MLQHVTLRVLLTVLATTVLSCQHAAEPAKDLDVALSSEKKMPKAKDVAAPDTAIVWKKYFKTPPALDERKRLETKLEKWSESGTPADLLEKGRDQVALGRYADAEVSFRESLRRRDDHPDAFVELSQLEIRKKNFQGALDLLSQARERLDLSRRELKSSIFRYRYTLALAYLGTGDKAKGRGILSDLIALDRSFSPGYVAIASSYIGDGKYGAAEFVAKRGLDRGKDDPGLYNVLGVAAEHQGRLAEAQQLYRKALDVAKGFTPALVNIGCLALRSGDFHEAEEYLTRALLYSPNDAPALVALGTVKRRQGHIEDARAQYLKALDTDPDNSTARFNLGVIMADDLHRPVDALRYFREVLQTKDENREIKDMAKVYIREFSQDSEM